jgi:hypothetical protein
VVTLQYAGTNQFDPYKGGTFGPFTIPVKASAPGLLRAQPNVSALASAIQDTETYNYVAQTYGIVGGSIVSVGSHNQVCTTQITLRRTSTPPSPSAASISKNAPTVSGPAKAANAGQTAGATNAKQQAAPATSSASTAMSNSSKASHATPVSLASKQQTPPKSAVQAGTDAFQPGLGMPAQTSESGRMNQAAPTARLKATSERLDQPSKEGARDATSKRPDVAATSPIKAKTPPVSLRATTSSAVSQGASSPRTPALSTVKPIAPPPVNSTMSQTLYPPMPRLERLQVYVAPPVYVPAPVYFSPPVYPPSPALRAEPLELHHPVLARTTPESVVKSSVASPTPSGLTHPTIPVFTAPGIVPAHPTHLSPPPLHHK